MLHQELIARLGVVIIYGLVLFFTSISLTFSGLPPGFLAFINRFVRAAFSVATALLLALCFVAFNNESIPMHIKVSTGISLVLAGSIGWLERRQSSMAGLHFLGTACIFLLMVIFPLLVPERQGAAVLPSSSWLLGMHIFTAIIGEGLCILAFCSSLLYLWHYRVLKGRFLRQLNYFPSLESLDAIVARTSIVGLFFISTSLVTGWALVMSGFAPAALAKVIWALVVWGWYVLCLFGRKIWGWRGRKGAYLCLCGALLISVALFGTLWQGSAP